MRFSIATTLALFLALHLLVPGCSSGGGGGGGGNDNTADGFAASTAVDWYALQLELIRGTPGFSPPVASRALGYTGVTLYEAIVGGMPEHRSLAGQLNGLTAPPAVASGVTYHWGAVANAALAEITRRLYPTAPDPLRQEIDDLEDSLAAGFAAETDAETFDRSVAHGRAVADWIDDWSLNDGGRFGYLTNFPADFVPPVGEGLWVPTPPAFAPALQPYWGENRPFVLESGASCQPGPFPPFSTDPASEFYAEANEVYETVQNLSEEQLDIALFWADNPGQTATPPGHWISIVNEILTRDGDSIDFAAEAYAKVGIAVSDAFISCWYAKYDQNLVRPLTFIQENIDATFTTPVVTPPFPEYTSGHSVQSGAAATVLTSHFGEDFAFTDDTHADLGLAARSFSSFEEAADEAAISRLYGGIHYRAAIDNGVAQGDAIGRLVNDLSFRVDPAAPATGAPASSYPATVATRWFDLSLDVVQTTPGFSPPVASARSATPASPSTRRRDPASRTPPASSASSTTSRLSPSRSPDSPTTGRRPRTPPSPRASASSSSRRPRRTSWRSTLSRTSSPRPSPPTRRPSSDRRPTGGTWRARSTSGRAPTGAIAAT